MSVGFSGFAVCPTPFVTYILCIVVDFAISLARGSPTSPLSLRIHIIYIGCSKVCGKVRAIFCNKRGLTRCVDWDEHELHGLDE